MAQSFRNPKDQLLQLLKESAPAGEGVNGAGAGGNKPEKKRQKTSRNVDMEKLAEALPRLGEDDLLQVVQMVHDNKTEETYTKNDVESKSRFFLAETSTRGVAWANTSTDGEFHVDLYTLPDPLIKMLWDFCDKKVDMSSLA